MALYDVTRNDDVKPGEFVSAFVIAAGTALARKAVARQSGVTAKNVTARRVDTSPDSPVVLSIYWDERDPDNSFLVGDDN